MIGISSVFLKKEHKHIYQGIITGFWLYREPFSFLSRFFLSNGSNLQWIACKPSSSLFSATASLLSVLAMLLSNLFIPS